MIDVLIGIPTFRRPKGLARLLEWLAKLETEARVSVLVADNDSVGQAGSALCEELRKANYRWPLQAIVVAERGIAQARNALVERALANGQAKFIAMLDDDEWPDANWLNAFLRVMQQTNADAIHGAVVRQFEEDPGVWATRCPVIASLRGRTGPIDMIHSTSNIILSRDCLERMQRPWFDPAFALTGGEDKEFFTRLRLSGARFAWADDAIVFAQVPASRGKLSWALKRSYRVGNSDMRVLLKYERSAGVLALEAAKIAGVTLLSPLQLVMHAVAPGARTAVLCRLWRAAGKIAAVCGRHFNEYETVHGN